MVKRIVISILLLCTLNIVSSQQDFSKDYKLLECKGDLPQDFKYSFSSRFEEDLEMIPTKLKSKQQQDLKEFYLKSNYSLKSIFSSGGVLFGDDLTIYVNEVAKKIIEANNIKGDLRFYVLKSSQVNAFCTQNGAIFVTVGLLSQIENESQLAFTLSHEIIHYTENHNIESFVNSKENERSYLKGRNSYEQIISKLSSYSQENELESDKKGFLLLKQAGYDIKEAKKMILVLEYAHLPFDEVDFDTDYFDSGDYIIPKTKFLESEKLIVANKSLSVEKQVVTHPEYDERKRRLEELEYISNEAKGQRENKTQESEFYNIRTIARFENLRLNLLRQKYERVLYEAYLLEKNYPKNIFIKECIGKALYSIAKIKTANKESDYKEVIEIEGAYHKLYDFLRNNMNAIEMSILSIKYIQTNNLEELKVYQQDLAKDLYHKHNYSYKDFINLADTNNAILISDEDTVEFEDLSKIDKLEYSRKIDLSELNKSNELSYYKLAFVDEIKDTAFLNMFKKAEEATETDKKSLDDLFKEQLNKKKKERNKENVGLTEAVAITPVYFYEHKKLEKTLILSEKKESKYIKALKQSSLNNNIKLEVLSEHLLASKSIEDYNKDSQLKECVSELIDLESLDMIPSSSHTLDSLMFDYKSDNLLFSGVFSYKNFSVRDKGGHIVLMSFAVFMIPTIIPIYAILLARNSRINLYYNLVYNNKEKKFTLVNTRVTNGKARYYNDYSVMNDFMRELSKPINN